MLFRSTGERETIPCGVVFRSVGYRGVELPGAPFDERSGTIPNVNGRAVDANGAVIPGLYCAGWIKRGPSGVIGTNKKDAAETVELLLADALSGALERTAAGSVDALLEERGVEVVTYAGWEAIDRVERSRGAEQGRPRVKLGSWDELLAAGTPSLDSRP